MGKYNYTILSHKETTDLQNETDFPTYFLGSTAEEAQETFNNFKLYINNVATVYASVSTVAKDDLFSECVLALAKAKKDFDPSRSSDFRPYAKYLIVDAIHECIRRNRAVIEVPSYISKANITINRLKGLLNNHNSWYDTVFNNVEVISEKIREKVEYHKDILIKAATRAKITPEQLIDRAEYLPIMSLETGTIIESEQESILAKIIVSEIIPLLTDTEKSVASLLMRDFNNAEIARELNRSDTFVANKINSIRVKILRMME